MNNDKKIAPKLPQQPIGNRVNIIFRKIASFLIELIVPVLVGMVAWYFLALGFKFWHMSDLINTILLVTTLIVVSFIVNRTIHYFKGSGQGKGILAAILSAIVIPVIVAVAANSVPVSGGNTVVTVALNQLMGREDYPFIKDIGNAIILSTDSKTKLDGIETLKAIHSELTLQELFRILYEDKTILRDFALYDELSKVIASYDLLPRNQLVKLLYDSTSAAQETTAGLNRNLYSYYYEKSFDGLRERLAKETSDSKLLNQKLLKLNEAETQLKQTLNIIETDQGDSANPTLNFVLDTFLRMDKLQSDEEIYGLAKTIAADKNNASTTRYSAILLVAKLGSKDDFNFIVPYLNDNSETMKAGALKAIGMLHAKLSALPPEAEKK